MKKKGFTLIELLAVIVILAIIALIATPIVMNVIENSKKGAAERSAENYLKAVETAVGTERIDGNIMGGEYTILSGGDLCPDGIDCEAEPEKTIKIEMSGNKPSSGTIFIENGKVVEKLTEGTEKTSLAFPDYTVNYKNDGKLEATKNGDNNGPSQGGDNSSVVYRWSNDRISIGDTIDPSAYTTDPTTLGTDFYLKHVVENNIVTESYVCAVFEGDVITCVRGGKDTYYNETKLILNGLGCNLGDSNTYCTVGSIGFMARSDGYVLANVGADGCFVDYDGSSKCESY